jgi:hypothetical protein
MELYVALTRQRCTRPSMAALMEHGAAILLHRLPKLEYDT